MEIQNSQVPLLLNAEIPVQKGSRGRCWASWVGGHCLLPECLGSCPGSTLDSNFLLRSPLRAVGDGSDTGDVGEFSAPGFRLAQLLQVSEEGTSPRKVCVCLILSFNLSKKEKIKIKITLKVSHFLIKMPEKHCSEIINRILQLCPLGDAISPSSQQDSAKESLIRKIRRKRDGRSPASHH